MNISNPSSNDLILLASTISIYISNNFTNKEIEILSTLFSTIGDNLAIALLDSNDTT